MGWILLLIVGIPILMPAIYLQAASAHGWLTYIAYIDHSLVEDTFPIPPISGHRLATIMEISIGINLALSVVDEFAAYIAKNFKSVVSGLSPEESPTLMESLAEAAQKIGDELGTPLNVGPLAA
jgi:hypothetical protein